MKIGDKVKLIERSRWTEHDELVIGEIYTVESTTEEFVHVKEGARQCYILKTRFELITQSKKEREQFNIINKI